MPEYLSIVGNTGRRMLSMVEDVLAFATIGGDLRPTRVSLTDLVRDVIADLTASLEESGASVHCGDLTFTADAVLGSDGVSRRLQRGHVTTVEVP